MKHISPRILFAALLLVALGGCRQAGGDAAADVRTKLTIQPERPKVGAATATVTLTGQDNQPVRGAHVKLEGNMNHAGMRPVFAEAKEIGPGEYRADLEFTMGGDWFVLIDATLADGRKLHRKVDVPGVESD
jgi:hypothetical protein